MDLWTRGVCVCVCERERERECADKFVELNYSIWSNEKINHILIETIYVSYHCVIAEIFTFHNLLQVTAKLWSLWKTFLVCLLA